MNTKYIVNNLSGQTINGNPIDPKYKVFTALLTQNGGDAPTQVGGGNILEGVRYSFVEYEVEGWDFTNVGGPKYPVSDIFTATATATPILWGGVALEYNAGAPVATVLENTIGNIWFTYEGVGAYAINSLGLFTDNKTFELINTFLAFNSNIVGIEKINDNVLRITTGEQNYNGPLDDVLNNTPIEIRVYN